LEADPTDVTPGGSGELGIAGGCASGCGSGNWVWEGFSAGLLLLLLLLPAWRPLLLLLLLLLRPGKDP
jgi:hypothetical protein